MGGRGELIRLIAAGGGVEMDERTPDNVSAPCLPISLHLGFCLQMGEGRAFSLQKESTIALDRSRARKPHNGVSLMIISSLIVRYVQAMFSDLLKLDEYDVFTGSKPLKIY